MGPTFSDPIRSSGAQPKLGLIALPQEGPVAKYFICGSSQRCRSSQHMPHDLVAGTGSKRAHAAVTWRTKERRKDAQWHFGKFSAQIPHLFFSNLREKKKERENSNHSRAFPVAPSSFLLSLSLWPFSSLPLCKSQNPNPRKETLPHLFLLSL